MRGLSSSWSAAVPVEVTLTDCGAKLNVFLDIDIEWEVGCPAITNLHSLSRKIDGGSKLFINVKKKISLKDIFHIL